MEVWEEMALRVLNRILRTLRTILRIPLRILRKVHNLLHLPLKLPETAVLRKMRNNHRHLRRNHNPSLILRKRRTTLRNRLKGSKGGVKMKREVLRKSRNRSILMGLLRYSTALMTILHGKDLMIFQRLPSN
jgi:hypothetical protein